MRAWLRGIGQSVAAVPDDRATRPPLGPRVPNKRFFADTQSYYRRWGVSDDPTFELPDPKELPPAYPELDRRIEFLAVERSRFEFPMRYTTDSCIGWSGTLRGSHRDAAVDEADPVVVLGAGVEFGHREISFPVVAEVTAVRVGGAASGIGQLTVQRFLVFRLVFRSSCGHWRSRCCEQSS